MTHLTGFRGNWISFSEHSVIIGKAGLNLFCNEACLRAAATLAFRKFAEFNVRAGAKRNGQIDGWINGQIKCGLTVVLLHRAHYQICFWAPTLPPDSFTLKIETSILRNVGKYFCTRSGVTRNSV